MSMSMLGRRRGPSLFRIALALTLLVVPARAEVAVATPPDETVSLAEALALALVKDPTLAPYAFERRALDARALQEGRPHNPVLGTEVENFGRFGGDEGDAEATQTTVSLSQVFELGGKRDKRAAVARLDGRLADWDYERARLETATRTFKAFVAALLAQERLALGARLVELARESVAAVRRQLQAGAGSPVELTRAEATLAVAEATVLRRERESRAARSALAAGWGDTGAGIARLAGTLAPLPAARALEELTTALASAPDLARFGDTLARAQAGVALEEARRVPDVTVRVGARRFVSAESNGFVAELSVPLPFFDRNADAVVEAEERLGKARAEQQAAALGAEAALRAGYEAMAAAYDEAGVLAARVLPRAKATLAETRRGYGEGRLRHLEVLEAERSLAELESEHLETLARYHTAAADLERLTGTPVTVPAGGMR